MAFTSRMAMMPTSGTTSAQVTMPRIVPAIRSTSSLRRSTGLAAKRVTGSSDMAFAVSAAVSAILFASPALDHQVRGHVHDEGHDHQQRADHEKGPVVVAAFHRLAQFRRDGGGERPHGIQ